MGDASCQAARPSTGGRGIEDLADWLRIELAELKSVEVSYRPFTIPKRNGGSRSILAPNPQLKAIQRTILRRLLGGLHAHPAATSFERGLSIVHNASLHAGKAVVVRTDLHDFFGSIMTERVAAYFRGIGWGTEASEVLCRLCTYNGSLPQGAPTSPRLSNLVNHPLDARLAAAADHYGATYTRYADELTFSFAEDNPKAIPSLIGSVKVVLREEGCAINRRKKLSIRRQHQQQMVTGLVVNQCAPLPRGVRRRLRAIRHRAESGRELTLSPQQLDGCRAFEQMVERQTQPRS
jgi:hypothetical protein